MEGGDSSNTTARPGARVLLTGGTGYIGGRLGPRLLQAGYRLRCVARSARKLAARPWASDPRVEQVEADLADKTALAQAMQGCTAGYYLIPPRLVADPAGLELSRRLAHNFAQAAEAARLERLVCLIDAGELGRRSPQHLHRQREIEPLLAAGSTPLTIFRATMVIGSGY
jgi:uncharacterized protein YbjT (DUF2867 family)